MASVERRVESAARSNRLRSCAWREAAKAVGAGALWLARRDILNADRKLLCTRMLLTRIVSELATPKTNEIRSLYCLTRQCI